VAMVNCLLDGHNRDLPELLQAWATLPLVAEAAASAGADVTVLQSGRKSGQHEANGVRYEFVRERRWPRGASAGLMPWRLTASLRRLNPDVVHFNGLDFPLHLRAACHAGAPVLVQDHASTPRSRSRALRRWSLASATACAFTAEEQAAPFRAAAQLPARLRIVAVPESSSRFRPGDQQMARARTGVFGDPAVLSVGRLNAGKDPLTVLRAVRLALQRLPGLQLWCAFGEADLLEAVEQMLREDPRLSQRVHLLGCVPHARVEALCRACDLFVSASRHEGSGYALLEALACGLTPVVSDIPPFRALTGNGEVGALVPVADAGAFAGAVVAQASKDRAVARNAVLDHFERELSPGALGRRLVAVYETVARTGGLQ